MVIALKEWPAVIHALDQGGTCLLVRKGGIHEQGFSIQAPDRKAFLFPAFEHQKNDLLKSPPSDPPTPYRPGDRLTLRNWVEFQDIVEIPSRNVIESLSRFHVWRDDFLYQRYDWKPERSLFCLLCRVYRLIYPVEIPYLSNYGGCRSWIHVKEEIAFEPCRPVLSDETFMSQFQAVHQALAGYTSYSVR